MEEMKAGKATVHETSATSFLIVGLQLEENSVWPGIKSESTRWGIVSNS